MTPPTEAPTFDDAPSVTYDTSTPDGATQQAADNAAVSGNEEANSHNNDDAATRAGAFKGGDY